METLTEEERKMIEWLKTASYDEIHGVMEEVDKEIFREKKGDTHYA